MRNITLKLMGALAMATLSAPAFVKVAHAQEQAAPQITLKVGDQAPELALDGWWQEKVPEKRSKGKVYVVDFWASWCPPCRESMPHLMQMQGKYGDYATFIGVSTDRDTGAAAEFLSEFSQGMEMPIYFAMDKEGESWDSWAAAAGRTTIPTTFIVNEENKIAWVGHPMQLEKALRDVLIK